MSNSVEIGTLQFASVYLLLIITTLIMKKARIQQTKLLLVASLRMTIQLILAGVLLTYIFKNPHPALICIYILSMILFASHRVLSQHRNINKNFKLVIMASLAGPGLFTIFFLVVVVADQNLANAQYTIPLGGMIMGNAMTGLSLGMKNFIEKLATEKNRIATLLNLGVHPKKILAPLVSEAMEMALLPTINSMVGMGIVWLPGMLTGQIISGVLPATAVIYQIAIMVASCTVVTLSVFCTLYFGSRTLYSQKLHINY